MVLIPKQLQKENIRFIKIRPNTKFPFEEDWVKTNNYDYKNENLLRYLQADGNYGIVTGNGLIVIDADTPAFRDYITSNLPLTFTVQTGRGGCHFFYYCDIQKKIIFEYNNEHLGELQTLGQMVVGANSIHPNGNPYIVINESEINKIDYGIILSKLSDYIKLKESDNAVYENNLTSGFGISKIIDLGKFRKHVAEYFGEHPIHGSTNGTNFWINTEKNVWHCFRHNVGGGVISLIAIIEGLIKCEDLDKRPLKGKLLNDTLKIARTKYGYNDSNKIRQAVNALKMDYLDLVNEFYTIQPFFYDRARNWWLWDFNNFVYKIIDETDLMNEIDEGAKESNINITISNTKTAILNAMKMVGRRNIPTKIKPTWIQFKEVIVDLETDERIKAEHCYWNTNSIPWDIGTSEDTPIMDKVFEEWVGKDNTITLYEILAYCMLPDYPLNRIFCFIGSGMNGKSKYLELLKTFIGHYNCCASDLDVLTTSRFEVTRLHKKLVCQIGETNFSEINKTSKLKMLSGGDPISFEYKNKDLFEDYNYAKILISTNNLPTTNDKTLGFYRRWMIIDFHNTFSEKKDILKEIPEQEYNNLALKSIRILKDIYTKREFANEGTVEERMIRYEEKSNFLGQFIKLFTIENPNGWIVKGDFIKKLNSWAKENRHREMSENTLGVSMKRLGYDTSHREVSWVNNGQGGRVRVWNGLDWKDENR